MVGVGGGNACRRGGVVRYQIGGRSGGEGGKDDERGAATYNSKLSSLIGSRQRIRCCWRHSSSSADTAIGGAEVGVRAVHA